MKVASVLLVFMLGTLCYAQSENKELKTKSSAHSVVISWTPSAVSPGDAPVASVTVYRGTALGKETKLVNLPVASLACPSEIKSGSQCYTDSGVRLGKTYYYQVTSTNTAGKESARSEEVQAVVKK